jgi:peroxiredoxin Q/BCP
MDINDLAPDFTTVDDNGAAVRLSDFRGQNVVLFFYPKANTPGCTIEACGFRDSYSKLHKAGLTVLGISADTAAAQKKFKEKFGFQYTLLADADKKIADLYGVLKDKNMYGKKVKGIVRSTFLIAPDGKIAHIFPKVTPEGHADEVLAAFKALGKKK